MDYEKKYNEALERAKSWADKYVGDWRNGVYNLPFDSTGEIAKGFRNIFPELTESEDERIRKDLMQLVKARANCNDVERMLAWLENQKEQKPAEWSEEDEETIKDITCVLHSSTIHDKDRIGLENWLYSLRPQPHWKPSEEQMEALIDAKTRMTYDGGFPAILQTLIDDLKKL